MNGKKLACLIAICAGAIASSATAGDGAPNGGSGTPAGQDLYAMDLQSLLDMKVVTASKFSEKISDAPGVMSVVTQDELRRFAGLTLSEILQRVCGLSGSVASFTDRSIIAARGDQTKINGGHILYLINGRPTREVLEGGLSGDLLETFPVNIIERIEVIRGPGSVLYGSNAFSAVVNVITKKATGNHAAVTGMGAAGTGTATSGEFSLQHGDLNVVGAAQFRQTPNWVTPVWTYMGGDGIATIPDRGKGAYVGVNFRGLSFMSSFTDWKTSYVEGMVGEARWRRGFADLGYSLKAAENWDMSFDLTYTRTALNAEKTVPWMTRDSYETVLEWTNTVRLSQKDHVTFGALFNYMNGIEYFYFTYPRAPIAEGSRSGGALYGQVDHQLTENVKLIGGFQANKIGDLQLNVVPRVGVIYSPASHVTLKALYSKAFRAPSLFENYMNLGPPVWEGPPTLYGDPNLRPEKVATIDIGVTYEGRRFQTGVNYFHSKQTDPIIQANFGGDNRYVNQGEARFQGFEVEGKYYLLKSVFMTGSTIYQTNDDGVTKNITPIANWAPKGGVSYAAANGLTASVFDVYQPTIPGYENSMNPTPSAHHLINANLRYDLAKYLPVTVNPALPSSRMPRIC
ncbi:MAG TPA: TonB-dependent receptor [Candidatus Limnocylindrales bacterium]|nr:TonB-dependent receptor [Candidatus Limnocylindrales bacterium]